MPGVLAGIIGAIYSKSVSDDNIGLAYTYGEVGEGNRTLSEQQANQFFALLTTLGISIFSGLLVGKIASAEIFSPPTSHFDDRANFDEAEEEVEHKPLAPQAAAVPSEAAVV